MNKCFFTFAAFILALAVEAPLVNAQALPALDSGSAASSGVMQAPTPQAAYKYSPPSESTKLHNYIFDAFGPYPLAGSAFVAGISQMTDTPHEWGQGVAGYSKRLGSDFGISLLHTTSRYTIAQALHEDTLFYRCQCRGFYPRLQHAVLATILARRGADGHEVLSLPALASPYIATTVAVEAWYPDRYSYKDAFRMGNYSLLSNVGANIGFEFLYSGPHALLTKLHLDQHQPPVDPNPGPNSDPNPSPEPRP